MIDASLPYDATPTTFPAADFPGRTEFAMSDSPGVACVNSDGFLGPVDDIVAVSVSFDAYFMFKPSGIRSDYVPVAVISHAYGGDATRNGTAPSWYDTADWTPDDLFLDPTGSSIGNTSWPTWTANGNSEQWQ
jgi:hypothetical protein